MLKSNPVKVRFAEEVIINGQVPVSSTTHTHAHTIMYDLYKQCQMVATYIIKTDSSVNARQIRHFMNSFFTYQTSSVSLGRWKRWSRGSFCRTRWRTTLFCSCQMSWRSTWRTGRQSLFALTAVPLSRYVPIACVCSTPPHATPPRWARSNKISSLRSIYNYTSRNSFGVQISVSRCAHTFWVPFVWAAHLFRRRGKVFHFPTCGFRYNPALLVSSASALIFWCYLNKTSHLVLINKINFCIKSKIPVFFYLGPRFTYCTQNDRIGPVNYLSWQLWAGLQWPECNCGLNPGSGFIFFCQIKRLCCPVTQLLPRLQLACSPWL